MTFLYVVHVYMFCNVVLYCFTRKGFICNKDYYIILFHCCDAVVFEYTHYTVHVNKHKSNVGQGNVGENKIIWIYLVKLLDMKR
jgi:hypothetical protein